MTKTKVIPKKKRDLIMAQVLKEVDHSREYKKKRVKSTWLLHDNLCFGYKNVLNNTRSNINILATKVKGFVNTLLSKVDSEPNIKFSPGEEGDLIKSRRANALLQKDAAPANGNWAFKDLMGKKGATKYGRTIFEYHASSVGGYKSHLTLIKAKNFLIDPSAGGIDIEKAKYLGRLGITKDTNQLKAGKKSGEYIKSAVDTILREGANEEEETQDEKENRNRYFVFKGAIKKLFRDDEFNFIEWGTTFEGERYYVLFNENSEEAIKMKLHKEVFKSNLWSFATYATDPDDDEFWTPSPLDSVVELFMGQHVLVNQQIDNNEQINQPMKGYDVDKIKNPAYLKWRRNGNIPFKAGVNIDKAFKVFTPPALTKNIETYNLLDNIAQTESGITNDTKGLSEQDTLGIYEGNLQASADRLGLLNKSYSDCYNRLGLLYYNGLKEHLNKKVAVKMIGNKGVQYEEITKVDIIPDGREFDIIVSSADVNLNAETVESKNKVDFLARYKEDVSKNQEVIFELEGEIVGFDPETIKRMQNTENTANAEVISQAANDFQKILQGEKDLKPYNAANTAYKQYMIDKLIELGNDIKLEIQDIIIVYIDSLEDIIIRNTVRTAKKQIATEALAVPPEQQQPIIPVNK